MAEINTVGTLVLLKLVTVALGFYLVFLGFRAYRSNQSKTTYWLTVGMALMTLGAISEGLAYQGLHWTIDQSHIFEAVVELIAFVVLVYSLYAK